MALRLVQVNFKARDDAALGRFWADALGWGLSSEGPGVTNVEPRGFDWPDPSAVCIDVVAVPDPETVHYRVHLELATSSAAHRSELVARLIGLGAASLSPPADGLPDAAAAPGAPEPVAVDPSATDAGDGSRTGTWLADPDGNPFRVLDPEQSPDATGPIAAVVVACADPRALGRFWHRAMDWQSLGETDDRATLRSSAGVGPLLEFVPASGGAPAPTRIHLDLLPYPGDDQAAEVARLRELGATPVDLGQGDASWTVLADPEGNDFCVLRPR